MFENLGVFETPKRHSLRARLTQPDTVPPSSAVENKGCRIAGGIAISFNDEHGALQAPKYLPYFQFSVYYACVAGTRYPERFDTP